MQTFSASDVRVRIYLNLGASLQMRFVGRLFVFCSFLLLFSLNIPSASAQTYGVQAMNLVSSQSGWLLADGRLFWTNSIGAQWTEITPISPQSSTIDGVFFRPDGSGWALLASPDGSSLTVARTPDSGAHWTYSSVLSPFTDASPFAGKASISFPNGQHGWMMLSLQSSSAFRLGLLLQTADGGAHWTQLPPPPIGGNLDFIDATHGFMGPGPGGDELYQTTDGGLTWNAVALPLFSAGLKNLASTITLPTFSDALHGTLLRTYKADAGTTVVQYQTTDGGEIWSVASASATSSATIVSLTADGHVTSRITAVQSHADIAAITPAGIHQIIPVRSSFSTPTQGWVLFTGGNCNADKTSCTRTSALMGTTDGGQTFFPLGKISGVPLQTTTTSSFWGSESPSNSRSSAEGIEPASSLPTIGTSSSNPGVMGFDACSLPTIAQLSAWKTSSPYQVVGVYLGGENYANCSNSLSSLNASYVSTILAQGWQIAPLWVGPQGVGACSGACSNFSTNPSTANQQGVAEADSAIAAMSALGIGQGSPIVYDMEAYDYTDATDLAATQAFLEGWDTELHAKGYLAAVYSSHPEFDTWVPSDVTPPIDIIWFAYFFSSGVPCGSQCQTVFPTPTSSFDLPANDWLNNHRARQTSSGFEQTYGSVQIDIDEDWMDASMVVATPNTLTVNKTGSGSVATTQISNGLDTTLDTAISCGDGCSSAHASFASTDVVTLVATPDAGATFSSWSGCTSTSGATCTVDVTSSTTVTAAFTGSSTTNYTLTVTKSGSGSGTVASSDSTISCGSACSASYASGATVTLTATPASNSVFGSWSGCASSSGNTCTVTMAAAESVTATFNPAPTFSAAVSASTLGITQGQSATDTITVTPQSGYAGTFTSFSCTGLPSGASCSFTPTTLTASGNGAALTTTLTLSTTVTTGQLILSSSKIAFAGLLLPSLLLPFALRRRNRAHSRKLLLLSLAAIALSLTPFLTGCGGSSGSSAPSGPTTIFNGTVYANFTSSSGTTQLPIQLTITK